MLMLEPSFTEEAPELCTLDCQTFELSVDKNCTVKQTAKTIPWPHREQNGAASFKTVGQHHN